jgi:peptidoglycan/LPS O-acetylase OafA/YrhL
LKFRGIKALKYRGDIDGLRAVAVLAVVAFHASPTKVSGGFVGVDVFFVISGFLITGIISNGIGENRFSIAQFYARRVRRIYPAMIVVLAFALLLGWFSLLPGEYEQLGKHAAGSAAFITNFLLVQEAGYFDNIAETKPLLHFWSLAVEEQFYLVWPFLLLVVSRSNSRLFAVTALILSGSFIYGVYAAWYHSENAFFLPFGRFWELLSGGLLFWLQKRDFLTRSNNRLFNESICIIAFVALCASILLFTEHIAFPGVWVAIPVVSTLVLIACAPGSKFALGVLSNPLSRWIGLISYPLYLWHWPLLSFLRIIDGGPPGYVLKSYAIALSFVLAIATYLLLERPMRESKRLFRNAFILFLISASLGFFGLLVATGHIRNGTTEPRPIDEQTVQENCSELFPAWNKLTDTRCKLQNPDRTTIALIGDSHSDHLFQALAEQYKNTEESVAVFPWSCQTGLINILSGASDANDKTSIARRRGPAFNKAALDHIASTPSIHTVVIGHNPHCDRKYLVDLENPDIIDHRLILEAGFRRTLEFLSENNKNVVIVLDNPELDFDPRRCASLPINWNSNRCYVTEIEHRGAAAVEDFQTVALKMAGEFDRVTLVDAANAICQDGFCYVTRDGEVLYSDPSHLSIHGARLVVSALVEAISSF